MPYHSPTTGADQADRRRTVRLRGGLLLAAATIVACVTAAGSASARDGTASRYSFAAVAYTGDAAPGGGSFSFDFEPTTIDDHGALAFTADVSTGGEGVFVDRNGVIGQVLRSGQPAPGGGTLGPGTINRLGFNDPGDVSAPFLLASGTPGCGYPSAGVFRYSHSTQTLSAVAAPGLAAPGGGTFEGVIDNVGMNNRGDVVFGGLATGTDVDPSSGPGCDGIAVGLFRQDRSGRLFSVVRPGDAAPGGGVFDDAWNGSINDAGDIAFGGHVAGEECVVVNPFACGESVYMRSAATGAIRSIAHQGDPAPGGGHFRVAFGGVINDSDQIAFVGDLTPPPAVFQEFGVFLSSGGTTVAVARPGDAMPGGGRLLTAGAFDATYGLNNHGDVGFGAMLDTDTNGDGIADSGLYVYSGGTLHLVARTGTVIPGVGTIAYLGFAPFVPFPLFTGGVINDRGQLPLYATLTDGRGVLLIATPSQ